MSRNIALGLLLCALAAVTAVLAAQAMHPAVAGRAAAATAGCEARSFAGSTNTAGAGGLMLSADLRELSSRSVRIVVGTVESFQTCLDPDIREPATSVSFAVSEQLKGPSGTAASPEKITFTVPGGKFGQVIMAEGTNPQFTVGEQAVVFLRQQSDGGLRLTADYQGKFSVTGGEVERASLPLDAFAATVSSAVAGELAESDDPLAGSAGGVVEAAYALTGFKWYSFPVTYYVNGTSNMPGTPGLIAGNVETAWNNAFTTWEGDPKSDVDFTSNGTTGRTSDADICTGAQPGDGFNDVTWGISGGADPSTLATTRYCGLAISIPYQLTDADIEFDNNPAYNGLTWRTDGTGTCGTGFHDVESVALHEIGHLLGLDHPGNASCPPSQCPVMNVTYVGVQRTPCQDDADGVASLYPAGPPAPSATPTLPAPPTNTQTPTATSTPTATNTAVVVNTPTSTATPTTGPTDTPVPTATATPTRTSTATPTRTATRTAPPTPRKPVGDVNDDGHVNSVDAALILQYNAGLARTLPNLGSADVNHNGSVNSIDGALVLQYVAGLLTHFGPGSPATPTRTRTPTRTPTVTPAFGPATYPCEANTCNCSDFPTHAEAQRVFTLHGGNSNNNWSGLDSDGDGIACEGLP